MSIKKIVWGIDDEKLPKDIELDENTKKLLKGKLKSILKKAKEEFDKIEEEWSNHKVTVEDITYFIEGERQEVIEPEKLEKGRPRPYKSYSECVLDEIEKEIKKL